jgi:radical SAM superfamily enzyme YgiQ (UPF0313 family)
MNKSGSKIPIYCVSDSCRRDATTFVDHTNATPTYPPQALGMLLAHILGDDELATQYRVVRNWIGTERDLEQAFWANGPGVYLFSDYIWTVRNNLRLSALAKRLSPRSITVHGGPCFPKNTDVCERFFAQYAHVDVGVRSEGEHTALALLRAIASTWPATTPEAFASVLGVSFRNGTDSSSAIVRTPERPREKSLDQFPSPYLAGVYDLFENSPQSWTAAIIETNRGCPYGCTFCDWGSATLAKIYQFSMERIVGEIDWCAQHKVSRLWIADANFGIFDRDIEITDAIVRAKSRHGYPRDVIVNYAKNATSRLTEIIRRLTRAKLTAQGIISIQTHDPQTLENVQRSNIKTSRYEQLIDVFRREGLPVASDLMIGLPGATIQSFKNDLQFFIDRQVHTVAYPVVVLPNSPMGDRDYMEKYRIQTDREGNITATASYTFMDLGKMKFLYGLYRASFYLAFVKYILYYAQIDHGILASNFLEAIADCLLRDGSKSMPVCHKIFMRFFMFDKREDLLGVGEQQWRALCQEVLALGAREFGLPLGSATDAVVEAQVAVMPSRGRLFPHTVGLQHDLVEYFRQFRFVKNLGDFDRSEVQTLAAFGAATMTVEDPNEVCAGCELPWDVHQPPRWELSTGLLHRVD